MERQDSIWPENWPSPKEIFQEVSGYITSIHTRRLLVGIQIIVRFKNGYGANILYARLQNGLTEIAPLKFDGLGINDYEILFDGPLPDLTWCYSMEEITGLCAKICGLPDEGRDIPGKSNQIEVTA